MSNEKNRVKIIGGTHKSRILKIKHSNYLRPTTSIVRERLFNWLGQNLTDKMILDLFAGSGILGFESASRNAKKVFMVERNFSVYQNLLKLKLELSFSNVFIQLNDALNFLKTTENCFDIVFLDPPYIWNDWDQLLHLLKKSINSETIIYIESNRLIKYSNLDILKIGKSGISKYFLCKYI